MARKIKKLVLHCSLSAFGNLLLIDKWHRQKGWDCVGYNAGVLNAHPHTTLVEEPWADGLIETGRDSRKQPAHVLGHNKDSLGLVMIGALGKFTLRQYLSSAAIFRTWLKRYRLPVDAVVGHVELDSRGDRQCPGIDMDLYRQFVASNSMEVLTALGRLW